MRNAFKLAFLMLCGGLILSGCANVKPRERDVLAKPEMAYDPRPLNTAFREHVYFSREGTSGGYSAAGGGCGCN